MIERTFDNELVRSIIGDKELYKRSGDYIPLESYSPKNQGGIYYLSVTTEDMVIGIIIFHVFNHPVCYQGHVNYLPKYWGSGLEEHTIDAIKWMFDNTECKKIVAFAPDSYPEVLRHSEKSGLRIEGYLKDSIIINGKIEGQTLVGIEKWVQQQQ